MKFLFAALLFFMCAVSYAQTLQLHYDFRHTVNPQLNPKNFLTLYFEYFKDQDAGRSDSGRPIIKMGSLLLKTQADFLGLRNNIGKFYMQVSQSFRCWRPKIYVNLQYSGGLGITEPKEYSYYIQNTYSIGAAYPFKWKATYMSAVLSYKYLPLKKPSHDLMYTLYWWRGLWQYKGEWSGDFSVWTQNKNTGSVLTKELHGKQCCFFAEPQFWYKVYKNVALGTKCNMFYHINTTKNVFEVYPTLAVRCKI